MMVETRSLSSGKTFCAVMMLSAGCAGAIENVLQFGDFEVAPDAAAPDRPAGRGRPVTEISSSTFSIGIIPLSQWKKSRK